MKQRLIATNEEVSIKIGLIELARERISPGD
jgi:hypothetical protein